MKTMKLLLTTLLIFGTMPVTQETNASENSYGEIKVTDHMGRSETSSRRQHTNKEISAEVELIRMVDPFGNEVTYSLSEKVMGRALKTDDYAIDSIQQPSHSVLCQKTLSYEQEMQKVELKLEIEMLVEELSSMAKPRTLSEAHIETLSKVPTCDAFQLPLTAINKLLGGYDYEGLAMANE